MQDEERKQTLSKGPIIATVYNPAGKQQKPGSYPDGFKEENFFPGKKLPKPPARGQDTAIGPPIYIGGRSRTGQTSYGDQELEKIIDRYLSELQKHLKGKNIKPGIVFMPYSRN